MCEEDAVLYGPLFSVSAMHCCLEHASCFSNFSTSDVRLSAIIHCSLQIYTYNFLEGAVQDYCLATSYTVCRDVVHRRIAIHLGSLMSHMLAIAILFFTITFFAGYHTFSTNYPRIIMRHGFHTIFVSFRSFPLYLGLQLQFPQA